MLIDLVRENKNKIKKLIKMIDEEPKEPVEEPTEPTEEVAEPTV